MRHELSPHEEGDFDPTKEEINRYLNRLEKDLTLSPFGDSKIRAQPEKRENTAADRPFYERARKKAASFLPTIDPDLEVSVKTVNVTPDDRGGRNRVAPALRFSHRSKPYICWTMEIEENDLYLDTELEDVVRTIYDRKAKGM